MGRIHWDGFNDVGGTLEKEWCENKLSGLNILMRLQGRTPTPDVDGMSLAGRKITTGRRGRPAG
jgi:hypothetical protein